MNTEDLTCRKPPGEAHAAQACALDPSTTCHTGLNLSSQTKDDPCLGGFTTCWGKRCRSAKASTQPGKFDGAQKRGLRFIKHGCVDSVIHCGCIHWWMVRAVSG